MTSESVPVLNTEDAVAVLRDELSLLMAHTVVSSEDMRIEAVVRAQQAVDDTKAMADLRDDRIRAAERSRVLDVEAMHAALVLAKLVPPFGSRLLAEQIIAALLTSEAHRG